MKTDAKLDALIDGYKANTEEINALTIRLEAVEAKMTNHEIEISIVK